MEINDFSSFIHAHMLTISAYILYSPKINMSSDNFNKLQEENGKMSWSVADAVDYKRFPADRSKTGGWVSAALVSGSNFPFFPTHCSYHQQYVPGSFSL